jgi:glycosyltransferase involved in cell wall biosynthesis
MTRRPVYITRKFPPSVGGMETLAAGVWRAVEADRPDAVLIAHGGSNRALPLWLPGAAGRLAWAILRRRVEVVLVGDALLHACLLPLLALTRTPWATMVMGLDITFPNRAYRAVAHRALRRAPLVLAISEATASEALAAGVRSDRIVVVRLGVPVPAPYPGGRAAAARATRALAGIQGEEAVVLLTLGRLVRRKGVRWFVEAVLPQLPEQVHHVVAGRGEDAEAIAVAARAGGVAGRVHLVGAVDEEQREALLAGADLFVQPNVTVPGDMEGFGLVTIEAAMRGTPVVAADLEGIRDAVVPGETGILLPSGDAAAWVAEVGRLVADADGLAALGARYGDATRDRYGEATMRDELSAALRRAARR